MEYFETKLSGETKYHGVIVDVTLDEVALHTGEKTKREVVHHSGGVAVLPVDNDGTAYCVRQFRYPFGKMVLECPAGKLEPGEEPRAAALREKMVELQPKSTGMVLDSKIAGDVYLVRHEGEPDPEISKLVLQRGEAKQAKNFAEADQIRDKLKARGIEVTDVPGGAVWKRV